MTTRDQKSTIALLQAQQDELRHRLDRQNKWSLKPVAIGIAVLGLAVLILWLITNDNSTMSMLLMLAGISLTIIALLLYFFSPSRYLRSEVADAMVVTDILTVRQILAALLIDSKGILIPASRAGTTKLFIPLSNMNLKTAANVPANVNAIFSIADKKANGLVISPPGHGLFTYAQRIGAIFTEDGLENEIKDVLENSLEIASDVNIKIEGDKAVISLNNIVNSGMCAALRKEDPLICIQTGCPICSLVGCMIVDGTGKNARVDSVTFEGKRIKLIYELIED